MEAYPPTHQYNSFTMVPKGPLKERVEIITNNLPSFFIGNRLLDVGCSWGYFSFANARNFHRIIALDKNEKCIEYCNKKNKYAHLQFLQTGFRDYTSAIPFDKIFLGNAVHHIFMEIGDWSWIPKLHALSDGEVLVEGADTTQCKDIRECIPFDKHGIYNKFQEEMSKYFVLKRKIHTTSYTPDRYLMLYDKRKRPWYFLNKLPVNQLISPRL